MGEYESPVNLVLLTVVRGIQVRLGFWIPFSVSGTWILDSNL